MAQIIPLRSDMHTTTMRLARIIARIVKAELDRPPPSRDRIYAVLNALAVVTAFILDGTTGGEAEKFFQKALTTNRETKETPR